MEGITVTIQVTEEILDAIARRVAEKQSMPPMVSKKLYTTDEVAQLLGKTRQTINIHIDKGLLKAKKIGNRWTITEEQLNNYINGK
jgi:excisionase family DNA binding protein